MRSCPTGRMRVEGISVTIVNMMGSEERVVFWQSRQTSVSFSLISGLVQQSWGGGATGVRSTPGGGIALGPETRRVEREHVDSYGGSAGPVHLGRDHLQDEFKTYPISSMA